LTLGDDVRGDDSERGEMDRGELTLGDERGPRGDCRELSARGGTWGEGDGVFMEERGEVSDPAAGEVGIERGERDSVDADRLPPSFLDLLREEPEVDRF